MSCRASVRIVAFKGGQRQSRKESQQAGRARRRLSSSMLMFNSRTLEAQTRTREMGIRDVYSPNERKLVLKLDRVILDFLCCSLPGSSALR